MIVFLVGPSAGYFDGNRKAFSEAAGTLRKGGVQVINPLDIAEVCEDRREQYRALHSADAVAVMPGWAKDNPARFLVAFADFLDIPIYELPGLAPLSKSGVPRVELRSAT